MFHVSSGIQYGLVCVSKYATTVNCLCSRSNLNTRLGGSSTDSGDSLNLVDEKNPQAVIHAVKTKLKHRGYGEDVVTNQQMNYTFKIERPEVKDGNSMETK